HDHEPRDAHAGAGHDGGCGRGGPHLHDPHGRAGGAAAPVHRGQRARREEPGHLMRAFPGGGLVRGLAAAVAGLALLAGSGAPARAGVMVPEVVVGGGWTWAVDGEPGTGGAAGTLAAEWPFASAWSFGAALFAQDMGTGLSTLQDPNTGADLGTVATTHRWSYGLEWRAEGAFRASGPLHWLWNGGMGYARQERDERGVVNDAV